MIVSIPDFLPRGLALAALAEWPDNSWPHWHSYDSDHVLKLASKDVIRIPPACLLAFEKLCCLRVDAYAGMDDAFPDLLAHGSGMHWIPEGGYLNWHRDAMSHPLRPWTRKLSASLHLSKDLAGGDLLIRQDGKDRTVRPRFNELVLFSPELEHSVTPVESPEGRKSIACFFWENTPSNGPTRSEFTDGDSAS